MRGAEIARTLWTWTPYLAEGFVWNIVISLAAMAVGTVLGILLALARGSGRTWLVQLDWRPSAGGAR